MVGRARDTRKKGLAGADRGSDIMISWVEALMAQMVVRNLDDDVKLKLQQRARQHGRSTEEEVREILREAVRSDPQISKPVGKRLRALFSGIGLEEDILEWRGQPATPARF
jgi:plasmid stability protein